MSGETAKNEAAALSGKRLPGEEGVWFFIMGDLLVFGIFFLTYLYYRGVDPDLYRHSQETLNTGLGLLNTLLLLTSSWFVAMAVAAVREGRTRTSTAMVGAGFLLGVGFVVVKVIEYGDKFAAGTTVVSDEFFMFYFMYTGIHLAHVIIGLGVLVFLFQLSRKKTAGTSVRAFESGGAFWHLVDLLWVVLFALLYLAR